MGIPCSKYIDDRHNSQIRLPDGLSLSKALGPDELNLFCSPLYSGQTRLLYMYWSPEVYLAALPINSLPWVQVRLPFAGFLSSPLQEGEVH